MRIHFNFVILIFVASINHENIYTTKISRFTVGFCCISMSVLPLSLAIDLSLFLHTPSCMQEEGCFFIITANTVITGNTAITDDRAVTLFQQYYSLIMHDVIIM